MDDVFGGTSLRSAWRDDARHAKHRGQLHVGSSETVSTAAEELIAGMKAATVRTRRALLDAVPERADTETRLRQVSGD